MGSDIYWTLFDMIVLISIHAPRVGSDAAAAIFVYYVQRFQSTLPVWGATLAQVRFKPMMIISIHAPRVGSDKSVTYLVTLANYFNPRSPCGERLISSSQPSGGSVFQSTLPVWGATNRHQQTIHHRKISIHAPRVGSDSLLIIITT